MFRKKNQRDPSGGDGDEAKPSGYPLSWPTSDRWNPHYSVPRNSLGDEPLLGLSGCESRHPRLMHPDTSRSLAYVRSTRDVDTITHATARAAVDDGGEREEFSCLTHWLEALAELYMNKLDNHARWDPRWLNVTCRERFEGLASATVVVVDYLAGDTVRRGEPISDKRALAAALQARPDDAEVRVIMVSDLSRFVMGALGQLYSVDPEFWFEHLVDSGYSASDSGLKLKNAVWMNWAERETRFRHRALPGIGRRTEWNLPRRARDRTWVHLRWGRLGLLNYLGRKGFFEDELETRLADGRWMVERDVQLDKRGLLMTKSRVAREAKKREKKEKKQKTKNDKDPKPLLPPSDETSIRAKTTNVYRAYSSFESLPKNPYYWTNRDLRVLAPEGASCWSGTDDAGGKVVIMLFDPIRKMGHQTTKEVTPALTFMPRAAEIESYTEEELWRTAEADETYLDPHPPPLSKKELRAQKKGIKKQRWEEKMERLRGKLGGGGGWGGGDTEEGHQKLGAPDLAYESESSYTSDTDYDEEYQTKLRSDYENPHPYTRSRDYARKYALATHDLVFRGMASLSTSQVRDDSSALPAMLARLALDDLWQLLAEMNLTLDHIDGDLAADLNLHLTEAIGITTRQNLCWMRSALHDVLAWAKHLAEPPPSSSWSTSQLAAESDALVEHVQSLQARAGETLGLLLESTALAQSSLVIDQTSGINKLTELAFLFVPLSFVTSIFSMQVRELTADPPALWTWGVSVLATALAVYLVRGTMRSPSVRVFAMHCRVTMLNRFTSSRPWSAAHRLNSVGNRAIAKFVFFFLTVVSAALALVFLSCAFLLLVMGGLWLGAAAAAIYVVVTRWPDPAALVPSFVALVLAAAGMGTSWFWYDEIEELTMRVLAASMLWLKNMFPPSWTLDRVDDEDLAKEGVNTYTRRAILMTST